MGIREWSEGISYIVILSLEHRTMFFFCVRESEPVSICRGSGYSWGGEWIGWIEWLHSVADVFNITDTALFDTDPGRVALQSLFCELQYIEIRGMTSAVGKYAV